MGGMWSVEIGKVVHSILQRIETGINHAAVCWLKSEARAVGGDRHRLQAGELFRLRRQSFAKEYFRRPDPSILNASIPVVFLGRNNKGWWVVRDAAGRQGDVFLFQGSALRFARRLGGEEPPAVVVLDQFPIELDADIGGTSSISVARKIGSLLKTLSNRRKRNPASLASPRPDRFQSKPCPVVTLAH